MQPAANILILGAALLTAALVVPGCAGRVDEQMSAVEDTETLRARAGGLLLTIADRSPLAEAPPDKALLQTLLLITNPPYPDAFADSLWRADDGSLWVRRQGGIAGITRWHGPLDPEDREIRHLVSLSERLPPPTTRPSADAHAMWIEAAGAGGSVFRSPRHGSHGRIRRCSTAFRSSSLRSPKEASP